ncbi:MULTISPECIES: Ger(x)C family spore germination protein [Lysinibacillus]|jgi:spore germination protein KC|uniref:Ger(X)C family spore germination protein n=1 Tax=Lysinibacillus fusiformis TaxID=28031 RepID=A0A2I0UZX8_9BACI|nr:MULTISPECIES: Ger(x)C family spore germination protein [Lysinibacillus]KUF35815.1 spore gernimation protein [Lysinibacillus sp. F5]PKU51621.1 Ger(x)C family spore germination protein [Lysinibacillus fusiformis]WCH50047.1 Ger(x)C family spore germination protein [Lysinibacillus sp. OF-1]SCY35959.1 germination protein, Ger(x)C family [Lysinibacillus sp. SG9]SDB18216.1 germination protein, Ger(x)C family [Lysinibacillus sp. TC-37]
MTKKHIVFLLFILTSAFFMTGCWDVTEPQRMYYVNAVGVDYEDNQYKVYLQIINFADVAKSDQPSGNVAPAEVGFAEGKTVEEAIYKLYRSSDQEIFWGHMRYLLFTERAMENERSIPVIDTFIRFRETRYHIWVYSTTDPIKDVMLITPILRNSLTSSKLSNPVNTTQQESFIEPQNLRNLIIGLNEPSHEVSIPYVSIMKDWETMDEEVEETTFSGVGILSKDGFKGFIKNSAAKGNQWMHNETSRGEVTFKLEGGERDYLTADLDKLDVKVKPVIKNNQVTFDITIHLRATLNGFKGKINSDEVRANIIKEVKKQILTTYEEGLKLDVDIYRFSEYLYRSNVKTWKKLEKDGKIPLTKDSIGDITIQVTKINPGRKTYEETIEE